MGNPFVRFCEGQESNCDMEGILWHCRESRQKQRKQTSSYSHGRLLSTRKEKKPPAISAEGSFVIERVRVVIMKMKQRDFSIGGA